MGTTEQAKAWQGTLTGLGQILSREAGFAAVMEQAATRTTQEGHSDRLAINAPAGTWPAVLAGLAQGLQPGPGVVVAVTASTSAAEDLARAAAAYFPEQRTAVLPAWETLPHERLSPRADTLARRMATFRRLAHPAKQGPHGPIDLLIVPIRALLQPVVAGLEQVPVVQLQAGQPAQLGAVAQALSQAAYNRVDMVTRRGEFAVRGGILDVFAPSDHHPVRIDFWGDQIESIRLFSVTDQRSHDQAPDGLWAPACRELLLTEPVKARAEALINQLPALADMMTRLSQGLAVEGMEALAPLLVERMVPVTDHLPAGSLLVFIEPERLRRRAEDLVATDQEFLAAAWQAAAAGAAAPIDLGGGSFLEMDQLADEAARLGCGWWTLAQFGLPPTSPVGAGHQAADAGPASQAGTVGQAADRLGYDAGPASQAGTVGQAANRLGHNDPPTSQAIKLAASEVPGWHGKVADAIGQLKDWTGHGWRVVLTTEGHGPAKRLVERLAGEDVPARLVDRLDPASGGRVVEVTTASAFASGFMVAELKLAVISERDLTGRSGASTRDMRKLPTRRRAGVDPLQLQAGDLVVHERHGVGRFVELVSRTVGAAGAQATREYLVLEYAASKRGQAKDRLYVPTDALDQVTKYVGGENPALSKLGGGDWAATKARARRAVQDMAEELIRLYAQRMATKGFAFSPDTPWQRELEDAFAYTETPDQLSSIDEVKQDMERPVPMDRLICGDVGYGKTEIAVRAAFKAVQDSKQVAVLAPTTLLVQQHLETFQERLAPFPVRVKALSRFQSAKEAAQVKEDLASGRIDVVIGTHALITGTVRFKDLGLVVVDEEQRFGVEHKETLKAQRPNVDVLSMSATPIPRTLEMAVSGIREMSTLATPPEERRPILTYVGPATPGQVAAAIRRELLRDGQVFYVHNRVRSINQVAARVAELVPEARVAVAHGQMAEQQLERVIVDFWEKRVDVLVCTTIVETGLDISNANTLIVDSADKFGLSQLHQLRGRVGRGKERAYAYFMYPAETTLTETAHDRLTTIATQSELGAGMQVAMKDLELRGAGNLLGGEQSGHIAGVGFDLYLRMIGEAVAGAKGEPPAPPEVSVDLPVDAHLPHRYIDHERLRLEAYTKIASATNAAGLAQVREELTDRYGPLPADAEGLFGLATLRQAARQVGIEAVSAQGRYIRLHPLSLAESQQLWLSRVCRGSVVKPATRTVLVAVPRPTQLGESPLGGQDLILWLTDLLNDLWTRDPDKRQLVG